MRTFRIALFLCLLTAVQSYAQNRPKPKRDKFQSYFGIVVAPVIPSNFLNSKSSSFKDTSQSLTMSFQQQTGFTFGATVRIGITKIFSIETGISQVRRNFMVHFSLPDSAINAKKSLAFVNYDIPINGLVYVQLFEKIYLNASLGLSITQYPSDVVDSIHDGQKRLLVLEGFRIRRTYFSANAGVGFEFRTEKIGTFYLGGYAKVPLEPIMFGQGIVRRTGSADRVAAFGPVNGGYFSIDLRYFLPTIRNKGDQPNKSLVE